jgi:hypothetical protein
MGGTQLLLSDRQGALIQRLRLLVTSTILKIVACLIEETCSLSEGEIILFDKVYTTLGMGQEPITQRPVLMFHRGKSCVEGVHRLLGPLLLALFIHRILQYYLHQSMD